MTNDWFIILLSACFAPALTFLVCWNLNNWLCLFFYTMVGGVFFCLFFFPISHMALPPWVHSLSYLCGLSPLSKSPRGELKLGRKTQWPSNVNAWQFIQLWKTSISYKSVVLILSLPLSPISPTHCLPVTVSPLSVNPSCLCSLSFHIIIFPAHCPHTSLFLRCIFMHGRHSRKPFLRRSGKGDICNSIIISTVFLFHTIQH